MRSAFSVNVIEQINACTFCIESTEAPQFYGSELAIWGWCFAYGESAPPVIFGSVSLVESRAQRKPTNPPFRFETRAFRQKRPDVQSAYSLNEESLDSGFVWRFPIAADAEYEISIFAKTKTCGSVLLHRRNVAVYGPRDLSSREVSTQTEETLRKTIARSSDAVDFQFYLDLPRRHETASQYPTLLGWCRRCDGQHVSALRARIGNDYFPLRYGLPRKDVYFRFHRTAGSLHSGFEGTIFAAELPFNVELEAQVLGEWHKVGTVQIEKFLFGRFLKRFLANFRTAAVDAGRLSKAALHPRNVLIAPRSVLKKLAHQMRQQRRLFAAWFEQFSREVVPVVYGNFAQYSPRTIEPDLLPARTQLTAEELAKFTIVTPSFNQAEFLEATLSSVVSQAGVRLDYIVMDGGSTDASPEIIARYSPHLKYWTSQKDGGQASAIAAGLSLADCGPDDIMAYLNSDDLLLPGALRFVAEYFHRHPQIDAVYGHRILIDRGGSETGRWYTPRHDPQLLAKVDLVPQETLFWRRRLYDKVGGIDPSFRFAMDWDLLVRFDSAGARMKRLPVFLGCFRVHQDSKTVQQSASIGAMECTRIRRNIHGRYLSDREVEKCFQLAQLKGWILQWLGNRGIRI